MKQRQYSFDYKRGWLYRNHAGTAVAQLVPHPQRGDDAEYHEALRFVWEAIDAYQRTLETAALLPGAGAGEKGGAE